LQFSFAFPSFRAKGILYALRNKITAMSFNTSNSHPQRSRSTSPVNRSKSRSMLRLPQVSGTAILVFLGVVWVWQFQKMVQHGVFESAALDIPKQNMHLVDTSSLKSDEVAAASTNASNSSVTKPTSQPTSQLEKTIQPTAVPQQSKYTTTVAIIDESNAERVNPATRAALKLNLTEIISLQGGKQIQSFASKTFRRSGVFCRMVEEKMISIRGKNTTNDSKTRKRLQQPTTPLLVHVTFNCEALFSKDLIGTGNYLLMFYGIRLAARIIGNINVLITCADAEDQKSHLIIPWVTGWFPAPLADDSIPIEDACGTFLTMPVQYMLEDMKYEMRRLAVALVGVPDPSHPSAAFSIEKETSKNILQVTMSDEPLFPNVELDDAVARKCL
jgi:hypothetical protein